LQQLQAKQWRERAEQIESRAQATQQAMASAAGAREEDFVGEKEALISDYENKLQEVCKEAEAQVGEYRAAREDQDVKMAEAERGWGRRLEESRSDARRELERAGERMNRVGSENGELSAELRVAQNRMLTLEAQVAQQASAVERFEQEAARREGELGDAVGRGRALTAEGMRSERRAQQMEQRAVASEMQLEQAKTELHSMVEEARRGERAREAEEERQQRQREEMRHLGLAVQKQVRIVACVVTCIALL
jgi:hypothetical protein